MITNQEWNILVFQCFFRCKCLEDPSPFFVRHFLFCFCAFIWSDVSKLICQILLEDDPLFWECHKKDRRKWSNHAGNNARQDWRELFDLRKITQNEPFRHFIPLMCSFKSTQIGGIDSQNHVLSKKGRLSKPSFWWIPNFNLLHWQLPIAMTFQDIATR